MQEPHTILIVDDDPENRELLERMLKGQGYHLVLAEDGAEALSKAMEVAPDLILLDILMPNMDGYEVCQCLRADPLLAEVPVIMVTALDDRQSRLRGIEVGADDFVPKPFDRIELRARVRTILRLNRYRKLLQQRADLQQAYGELEEAYRETLEGWSRALELRDAETKGHSQRVTEMTLRLAQAMGIKNDKLSHIRRGALLHDIGKMSIPDSILFKPGPLSEAEWLIMRKHPIYAYNLLEPIAYLRPALDIPLYHHEKWDGTGYPKGLRGKEIPLPARIFALVDVWDALGSKRPYRPAWPEEKVLAYLREQSGMHFDPAVVETFFALNGHESVYGNRHPE